MSDETTPPVPTEPVPTDPKSYVGKTMTDGTRTVLVKFYFPYDAFGAVKKPFFAVIEDGNSKREECESFLSTFKVKG